MGEFMMKQNINLTAIALLAAIGTNTAHAEDINFSGKIFFDYSAKENNGVKSTGGDITRTYLTAAKKLDDTWSAKVTFDSALNKTATGKKNEVFLKIAQLTGKFSDQANIKLGMIGTPWIGYADGLNGHRYIAKSYVDSHGLDASADAGIGAFGKVMDGLVSYDVVMVNGGGYGNTTATAATDINSSIGMNIENNITLDVGLRNGYKGSKGGASETKSTLFQVLATYSNEVSNLNYRAGLNLISSKKSPTGGASTTDSAQEMWIAARQGKLGGFVRIENTSFDAAPKSETRLLLSADYFATKDVTLSLVSDTISNVAGAVGAKKTSIGMYSQFKF